MNFSFAQLSMHIYLQPGVCMYEVYCVQYFSCHILLNVVLFSNNSFLLLISGHRWNIRWLNSNHVISLMLIIYTLTNVLSSAATALIAGFAVVVLTNVNFPPNIDTTLLLLVGFVTAGVVRRI